MPNPTNDPIYSTTLTSSVPSVTLTIPNGYTHVRIMTSLKADGFVNTYMRINGDSTGAYSWTRIYGANGSVFGSGRATNSSEIFLGDVNTSSFTSDEIYINNYLNTNFYKNVIISSDMPESAVQKSSGTWRNSSAVTSVTIYPSGANFVSGSTFKVYGILAATISPKATGGLVYQDSASWFHVFDSTKAFVPNQSLTCEVLVVGGGAGGRYNFGGGGGGGAATIFSNVSFSATSYTVTVGAGGAGDTAGTGYAGTASSVNGNSANGGSAGIAGGGGTAPAGGASGNGYAGGAGSNSDNWHLGGGGGGGAAVAGLNATNPDFGPVGGDGIPYVVAGNTRYFGGGGNCSICY